MDELSLPIAFTAGLLSLLSPCVVPMVPVYLVSLTGAPAARPAGRTTTFLAALSFVLGFSLVFTIFGAAIGLVGALVPAIVLRRIAGTVLVLFGVFLLLAPRVPWLNREARFHRPVAATGYLRSFLLGTFFSLGWAPCVGPILGGILSLASSTRTVLQGAYLLLAYSAGLGVPFLAAALGLGAITPLTAWASRHGGIISTVSGALLVAVGIMMYTGTLALLNAPGSIPW
ncbi:MAG: cytochrome c biogenesis CcdA family protein [Chloroflexota bacterium]